MQSCIEILNPDAGIYSARVKWLGGASFLSSNAYILKSANGIIIIDTGSAGSGRIIADGMVSAGLNPGDITGIALSHWHSDHTGGAAELVSIARDAGASKIKVFIHKQDSMHFPGGKGGILRFHPVLKLPLHHTPGIAPAEGECEYVLLDECAAINPLAAWGLEFIHAPGHTPGNISFYHRASCSLFSGSGLALIDDKTVGIMSVFTDRDKQVESAKRLAAMDFIYLYPAHLGVRKDPIPPGRRIPVDGKIKPAERIKGLLPLFRYS